VHAGGKCDKAVPQHPERRQQEDYADQPINDRIGGFESRYKCRVHVSRGRMWLRTSGRLHPLHHICPKATREVRFIRARLGGLFYCAHGAFENPDGIALSADGITVNGNAFLSDWFSAKGAVRFDNATIKGDLH
jgi:hypothetical protein